MLVALLVTACPDDPHPPPADAWECPLEVCDNGLDDDCDGETDCEDASCAREACDDGDPCTYGDRCTGRVAVPCVGTPLSCVGEGCVERTCNGSATCTETPREAPCESDENPCTADLCRDGECAHEPLPDNASCGRLMRCCGGECVDIVVDASHCGVCGVQCPRACRDGACDCTTSAECVTAGYGPLANCPPGVGRCECACDSDPSLTLTCEAQCPGSASCSQQPGLNACVSP